MSKHVPKSIWLVTLLMAVILGIVAGIALPQNAFPTLPIVVGWALLPFIFAAISGGYIMWPAVDSVSHVPVWLQWLVLLYYPLAMLMASACAYWTLWSTGRGRQALLVVGLLAGVSALVCVPVGLVAPSLNSNGTLFALSLTLSPFVLLNLVVSAGLGWCLAWLILKPKRAMAS